MVDMKICARPEAVFFFESADHFFVGFPSEWMRTYYRETALLLMCHENAAVSHPMPLASLVTLKLASDDRAQLVLGWKCLVRFVCGNKVQFPDVDNELDMRSMPLLPVIASMLISGSTIMFSMFSSKKRKRPDSAAANAESADQSIVHALASFLLFADPRVVMVCRKRTLIKTLYKIQLPQTQDNVVSRDVVHSIYEAVVHTQNIEGFFALSALGTEKDLPPERHAAKEFHAAREFVSKQISTIIESNTSAVPDDSFSLVPMNGYQDLYTLVDAIECLLHTPIAKRGAYIYTAPHLSSIKVAPVFGANIKDTPPLMLNLKGRTAVVIRSNEFFPFEIDAFSPGKSTTAFFFSRRLFRFVVTDIGVIDIQSAFDRFRS